jgi:hypothetical protein
MPSSGMLHHVALARTDISEEHIASIIMMTRISELRATLAVTSNQSMLQRIPKCWFLQEQYSIASQKTAFFKS